MRFVGLPFRRRTQRTPIGGDVIRALRGRSGSSDAVLRARSRCSRANTAGRTSSVARVAAEQAADHRAPSGAVCSPPSPSPSAIGTMPAIIAQAGHQDRPQPARGPSTAAAHRHAVDAGLPLGERHEQDRVRHRHADRHDRAHERLDVQRRAGEPEREHHAREHRRHRRARPPARAAATGSSPPAAGRSRRPRRPGPSAGRRTARCIGAIWPRTATFTPSAAARRRRATACVDSRRRRGRGPRRRRSRVSVTIRCML